MSHPGNGDDVGAGPRYALYFVPAANSDLFRCGSAILGYDCYTGVAADFPEEFEADAAAWAELTAEPRRYGFHATLKAPFRLAPSCTEGELVVAFKNFTALAYPTRAIAPAVEPIGDFIAIVPSTPEESLNALAGSCTMAFDGFRAPLLKPERERRLTARLTLAQVENLDRWGYPYVFDEFRFHMTLAGRMEPQRQSTALSALRACVRRMNADRPFAIDRLALVKQASEFAPFRVLTHASLRARA